MGRTDDLVLQKLRDAGITPRRLKTQLGISDAMASRMMAGQRGIHRKHFDQIALLLKTDLPGLLSEKIDPACHPDPVHFARLKTVGSEKLDAEPSDATRYFQSVLKELSEAAGVFKELALLSTEWSVRAREWGDRLADLQVQSADVIARGQAAMGGSTPSGLSHGRRGRAGPAHRPRRSSRKTA